MAHFMKLPKTKSEGKVIYSDGIIDGIVIIALTEVPYAKLFYSTNERKVAHNKSVNVVFEKDGVHIDVIVKVHFSQCVSDMAFKIQETIRHNVESMTDYHVSTVNVIVRGVMFDEIVSERTLEEKAETEEKQIEELKDEKNEILNDEDSVSLNENDGEAK